MFISFIFGCVGKTKKNFLLAYIIILSIILLLEIFLAILFEFADVNGFFLANLFEFADVNEFLEKIIEFTGQEEDLFKKELLIFLLVSIFFCVGSLIFGLAYYISEFNGENQEEEDVKNILNSS